MYKIEIIRVIKWFVFILVWIVLIVIGVCIIIFEIKFIMKVEICYDLILFVFNFCKYWELNIG